ncbi:MAG: helix-turn-helix transcriptional regulator [Coriobacteriaceae bacterium]|jgi:transcriptional regulator with XRE-family HTH domain|nr:helix-turn-helix transcriptional regulator [Coriobacteriaceae bacterium]
MEAEFKYQLGRAIALRRKECELSKQRFALMIGISRVTLRRIEDGTGNPTVDILLKVAEGLGTDLYTLIHRAEGIDDSVEYRIIDI